MVKIFKTRDENKQETYFAAHAIVSIFHDWSVKSESFLVYVKLLDGTTVQVSEFLSPKSLIWYEVLTADNLMDFIHLNTK